MKKKKPGASEFRPIDTSVQAPSLGSYSMRTQAMGDARSPDMRMKTVDGDTLNAEWEYITKRFKKQKFYIHRRNMDKFREAENNPFDAPYLAKD